MIQQISNIKKLFKRHKHEGRYPMASGHGNRCLLHVANLALFAIVMILTIASTLIYYLVPITKVFELNKMVDTQKVETDLNTEPPDTESATVDPEQKEVKGTETFNVINEKNVFSYKRKDWVVKAAIPKPSGLKKRKNKKLVKKRVPVGKPKKIILHGVVIVGDMKKALINNPLKGVSRKKTLYVEEGDELEGYKVTSIEKDHIRLDWHGEEIIIPLYSGLNDIKKSGNAGKVNKGSITEFEYKYRVVEDIHADKIFNEEVETVAYENMLENDLRYLVYKEPEYFPILSFQDSHLPEEVDAQEVAELLPDTKSLDVVLSGEKQITIKTEIPKSNNSVAQEKLIQKSLSGKPSEILLNGIVLIASRDIKKALINIPMSSSGKDRTLCVEEGDIFEGYKVTSIESDLIRLDLHGEEIVMSIHSGLKDFAQKDGYDKKIKLEGIAKVDNEIKVIKYAQADEVFNDGVKDEVHEDILDDDLHYLVYKEPEYFSMPSFQDAQLPEEVEVQEVTALLPDTKSHEVVFFGEKQIAIKSEILESIDAVAQEKSIQKSLPGKPSEITLNGIVIVATRGIKKALVNVPTSSSGAERTLCVEEGDTFEGYKVTSIESDLLRLDLHGEEIAMTIHSGLKYFKQDVYAEKSKQDGLAKLDNKIKVVENTKVEEGFDAGVEKIARDDMLDYASLSIVYEEPEFFAMPVHLSEAIEIEDDDELFPFCSFPD